MILLPSTYPPLVSVIVRTMGRSVLSRALLSVLNQVWRPIELVVVVACGAKSDVINQASVVSRCDLVVRIVDPGIPLPRARAANIGLEAARGDWLIFLDEDDTWEPTHLSGLMSTALKLTDLRIVYSNALLVRADHSDFIVIGGPLDRLRMCSSSPFAIHAAIFPRRLADSGIRFDERLHHREDQDFWLQASLAFTFAYVDQTTAVYHVTEGTSLSEAGMSGRRKHASESEGLLAMKWRELRSALTKEISPKLQDAQNALLSRNYPLAEQILLEVKERFPKEVNTCNLLGMIYLETGRIESAISHLRLATGLAPGHYGFALNLALALERKGDTIAARSFFQRALELNPDCAPAKQRLQ